MTVAGRRVLSAAISVLAVLAFLQLSGLLFVLMAGGPLPWEGDDPFSSQVRLPATYSTAPSSDAHSPASVRLEAGGIAIFRDFPVGAKGETTISGEDGYPCVTPHPNLYTGRGTWQTDNGARVFFDTPHGHGFLTANTGHVGDTDWSGAWQRTCDPVGYVLFDTDDLKKTAHG